MDYSLPGCLSMGFPRQEYWSELPCPPPGDLPNSGIKPRSPALQADSLPSEPPGKLMEEMTLLFLPASLEVETVQRMPSKISIFFLWPRDL